MITLTVLLVIALAIILVVGIVLLIGGAALLPIVLDLTVAVIVIGFIVKILSPKNKKK